MTNLKLLYVEDDQEIIEDIDYFLKRHFNKIIIAQDGEEAFNYFEEKKPDMVILDINIPGGKTTEMITEIRNVLPEVKILMFSAHEEESYALRYIHTGADGYLNKLSGEENIVEAVKSIMDYGKYLTDEIIDKLNDSTLMKEPLNPFDKLSKREVEIVKLLVKGEGNLEISNGLGIQMSTVSTYKNRVFEKLRLNNLVELIEKYNLYHS